MAAAMSSRINEALHRLSDPLRRAEYILAQEGFAGEETDKLDDMALLMDVMEAREGLASAECPEKVAEIRAANQGTCVLCPAIVPISHTSSQPRLTRHYKK